MALVLNPSSGHASLQFHVVFDDEFALMPAMKSKIVPWNWAQLVTSSSESVSQNDKIGAKVWFNQMHLDPDIPEAVLPSLMANRAELLEPGIENKETHPSLDYERSELVQSSPDSEGANNNEESLQQNRQSLASEGER